MKDPDSIDVDLDDDEPIEAPSHMRGARRMLTIGAGRGGVGKSLLAANLAIYFAQLGKEVVLVDADPSGANLHTHFGLKAASTDPSLEATAPKSFEEALVQTNVPGLRLFPAAHDAVDLPFLHRAGRKARWLAKIRALPCEYLVIDAGPGHNHFALDLMLAADVPIAVTVPEPPAIEATYRFMRAAFRRRLRRALARDRYRLPLLERALTEIGSLPSPLALVRSLARIDRTLADLAWSEANRMHLQLVVNQTRVRSDLELAGWMSGLASRHYGVPLEELGDHRARRHGLAFGASQQTAFGRQPRVESRPKYRANRTARRCALAFERRKNSAGISCRSTDALRSARHFAIGQ